MYLKVNQNKEATSKLKDFMYISMTPEIYNEMFAYVDAFDKECSGTGLVKQYVNTFEDGHTEVEFRVSKIFLPEKQDNTSGSTEFSGEEANRITTELVMQGISPEEHRFHWHSHNAMETFHSSTDEALYSTAKTGDFLVSIVANKARSLLGRVDYYRPPKTIYNELPVFIKMESESNPMIEENIKKVNEYEASKPITTHQYNYGYLSRDFETAPLYETDFRHNGKKKKKKNKRDAEDQRETLHYEIIQTCYDNICYLESAGDILMIAGTGETIGFKNLKDGKNYKIIIVPLPEKEVIESDYKDPYIADVDSNGADGRLYDYD